MASITVNYNLKDAGYANYASQTIRFTLMGSGAKSSTDYVVAKGFVESTSDANGDGSVTLYRTALSGIANNLRGASSRRRQTEYSNTGFINDRVS